MANSNTIEDLNRELAKKINHEARANPQSPYSGKYVGIANGKVVVVADNWDDLILRLRQVEPDPQKILALEADADYDTVQFIWRVH